MSLSDELLKLEQLRQQGVLDNTEFAQAKAALLAAPNTAMDNSAALVKEAELARIDREWEMEKSQYMIATRGRYSYGQPRVPSRAAAVVTGVFGAGFGAVWIFMSVGITSSFGLATSNQFNKLGFDPFAIIGTIFPLLGVGIILSTIWAAVSEYKKAGEYEIAYKAYLEHRSKIQ